MMFEPRMAHFSEPELLFQHGQRLEDPRDGLALFGPLDPAKPDSIRWGVIGTADGITKLSQWIRRIQTPVVDVKSQFARPFFPGFQTVFRTRLSDTAALQITLPEPDVYRHAHNQDKHQRVSRTVELYTAALQQAVRTEDAAPDFWYVIIPEYVFTNCRPQSQVHATVRTPADQQMNARFARGGRGNQFLFPQDQALASEYEYEVNFHNQLKARLLSAGIVTQIVREPKLATEVAEQDPLATQLSAIAWSLATATFYKAGARPWKLGAARLGVCYIGLVFKRDESARDPRTACCAAQMFLDSGDGVVFRGAVGPWYQAQRGHFHLDRKSAAQVIAICVESYRSHFNEPPAELFIHGKVAFEDEEWQGFLDGAGSSTKIVGVRIKHSYEIKLFRPQQYPLLRGSAVLLSDRKGYLWTSGMVPRLKTYPGREVPNPLRVDVVRGEAGIDVVMQDILALTKLNYNSCRHSDGHPVTLKFADAVGEILTAGPAKALAQPPLPFKHYI